MNWTIEHIEEDKFVRIETEGHFSDDDSLAMLEDLLYQDYWKTNLNIFIDNRKRDYDDDNIDFVKQSSINFIKNDAFVGCGKIVLLMKTVADFKRGKQFEMLTDEEVCADVGIFLNEEQALRWIKAL